MLQKETPQNSSGEQVNDFRDELETVTFGGKT